jgi:hypothetical protein
MGATTRERSKNRKAVAEPRKPMMKARFSEMVAVNFQIDQRLLRPLVPKGLELDFFNDETYVSLIAMTFRGVKAWGLPFSIIPSSPELSSAVLRASRGTAMGILKGTCLIKDYVAGATAAWYLESQFRSDVLQDQNEIVRLRDSAINKRRKSSINGKLTTTGTNYVSRPGVEFTRPTDPPRSGSSSITITTLAPTRGARSATALRGRFGISGMPPRPISPAM